MNETIVERVRWTTADLDGLPNNGTRYEIIDGELCMLRAPHIEHQRTCGKILYLLTSWSLTSGLGEAFTTPGVLFGESDNVIPDLIWVSKERLSQILDSEGHLVAAPELMIEVLSYGAENERRDKQSKLKLYSTQGVQEYWIADWQAKTIEVYRRERGILRLTLTLFASDELTSPLLPGFACLVKDFFVA